MSCAGGGLSAWYRFDPWWFWVHGRFSHEFPVKQNHPRHSKSWTWTIPTPRVATLESLFLFNLRNYMKLHYRSESPKSIPKSLHVHLFWKACYGFFTEILLKVLEQISSFVRNQNAFLLIHGWTVTPLLLELLPFLSTTPTPATATAVSDVLGGVKAGPLAIALRSCCALGLVQFHAGHWA